MVYAPLRGAKQFTPHLQSINLNQATKPRRPKAESQLSAIQPLRRYSLPPSAVLSLSLNLYGLFLFIFLAFHNFFLGNFGS